MSAHSQTPPESVGPVPPEGISGAILSRHLHTPRHLQGVWDQFSWKESLEQSCLDVYTLPDTSRECGTSSPRRNLWSNLVQMSAVTFQPPPTLPEQHTRAGALIDDMPDLMPPQDTLTDEDIHYWMHGDDEEDEATVCAMIEAAEDPQEALKQRLYCGGAYVEEIIDD